MFRSGPKPSHVGGPQNLSLGLKWYRNHFRSATHSSSLVWHRLLIILPEQG